MQRGNREVRAVLGTDVKMLRHFVHAALDRDPKVGTGSGLAQRPAWGVNRGCSAVEIAPHLAQHTRICIVQVSAG
jgi:hypothetical protein